MFDTFMLYVQLDPMSPRLQCVIKEGHERSRRSFSPRDDGELAAGSNGEDQINGGEC